MIQKIYEVYLELFLGIRGDDFKQVSGRQSMAFLLHDEGNNSSMEKDHACTRIHEIFCCPCAQPTFKTMMLEYPELHEESVSNLVMLGGLTRMMRACGIRDFSMQDIMAPGVSWTRYPCVNEAHKSCQLIDAAANTPYHVLEYREQTNTQDHECLDQLCKVPRNANRAH